MQKVLWHSATIQQTAAKCPDTTNCGKAADTANCGKAADTAKPQSKISKNIPDILHNAVYRVFVCIGGQTDVVRAKSYLRHSAVQPAAGFDVCICTELQKHSELQKSDAENTVLCITNDVYNLFSFLRQCPLHSFCCRYPPAGHLCCIRRQNI